MVPDVRHSSSITSHLLARVQLRTIKKVGMAPVSIASLHPLIQGMKTRNRKRCHAHFLASFKLRVIACVRRYT